jgi:phosphoglucomutase
MMINDARANDHSHRKKLASVGAANQVFFVVTKSTGSAPTASASVKLAARTVTQIKVLVCLNNCISLGVF